MYNKCISYVFFLKISKWRKRDVALTVPYPPSRYATAMEISRCSNDTLKTYNTGQNPVKRRGTLLWLDTCIILYRSLEQLRSKCRTSLNRATSWSRFSPSVVLRPSRSDRMTWASITVNSISCTRCGVTTRCDRRRSANRLPEGYIVITGAPIDYNNIKLYYIM